MGTAVLRPQDCLAAPQSDQNLQFSCVSEYPSPKHGGRVSSATFEAAEFGRDVIPGNTMGNRSHSLLSCKNSSAGLLPLPEQRSQNAHSTHGKLARKMSACISGTDVDSYVSKQVTSSHHSNFSSYASAVCFSRCPSVPMLDRAARAQRLMSDCFPLKGVQLQKGRPQWHDARFFSNAAHGNRMAVAWPCTGGTALSSKKPEILANRHLSDALNPICLNWAGNINWNGHDNKRMHPEFSQVEVYMGRQCAKPPCGQEKSICKDYVNAVGRKSGTSKHLKRSASEILQKRSESPVLQKPSPDEAAKKLMRNLSQGVVGSHVGKFARMQVNFALPGSFLEGKKERSPRMQVFPLVEHKEVNVGDQVIDSLEFLSQDQYDVCKVDGTSTFDSKFAASNNIKKHDIAMGSEKISRSHSSDSDNDEMWALMMNDEKWAGPSFFNSPPPSSLPVPSFALPSSRTLSTRSESANTAHYNALVFDKSLLQEKCTWDVAFATKDLRRMLHLDCASCDL